MPAVKEGSKREEVEADVAAAAVATNQGTRKGREGACESRAGKGLRAKTVER